MNVNVAPSSKSYDNKKSFRSSLFVGGTLAVGVFFGGLYFAATRYVRCPPNKLMVVYGRQKTRFFCGAGSYVWPIYQQHKFLSFSPMQIPIELTNTLTLLKLRVNIPSVFTVAIGKSDEMMERAANRLLDMDVDEIKHQAAEIIFGQFRDVVATMDIESINGNRALFSQKVADNVGKELEKYGLVIVNVNFKDITDDAGVIEQMGKKAAEEVNSKTRNDVATAKKVGDVGEATQQKERDSEVALQRKERDLLVRLQEKEREITLANLQKEQVTEVAKAETERDSRLKEQEILKEISINKSITEQAIQIRKQNATKEGSLAEASKNESVWKTEQLNDQRVKIAKSNAETTKQDNDYKAQVAMSNAELARIDAQAEIKKKMAEIEISEAKLKLAEALAVQVLQEKKCTVLVEAEIERQRRIIVAQGIKEQELLEIEVRARAIEAIEVAKARGVTAHLKAESDYVFDVVQGCGSADGAVRYRLVDKVPAMAKYSAEAVQNIKFDKIVVWDKASDKIEGGKNATANFISNLIGSVAPAGDLVKNVLGVNMEDYLGSKKHAHEQEGMGIIKSE